MQRNPNLRLFKRGPSPEVRLLVIVVVSLVLLVVDSRWAVLEPARRAVALMVYPFQRVAMAPRDVVDAIDGWLNAANQARTEKEALQRQRIELAQLASHMAQLTTENQQLRRLLSVTELGEQKSIAVEVLYEPANAFNHHLVFNKGSNDGIAPGMPVIDEGGVVGQVIRVTPLTSEAALLTDSKVSVPVQVVRNGLRLIAFGGNPDGKIEVRYLPVNADIEAGDDLVTSGIGGLFPAGLAVGRVEDVRRDTVSGFAMALVRPSSHPERYRHFLVLGSTAPSAQEAGQVAKKAVDE